MDTCPGMPAQIAKTLGSLSIRYRSDAKVFSICYLGGSWHIIIDIGWQTAADYPNEYFNLIFSRVLCTVYPKKYAHGFCFAVLSCGYTSTDFPISIRLTSLALWQLNDCPSASKAILMNMDKYFMWIHYVRLHNHNKAKHNKTVCIFHGIYSILAWVEAFTIKVKFIHKLFLTHITATV